jgi:hypothetical protein
VYPRGLAVSRRREAQMVPVHQITRSGI